MSGHLNFMCGLASWVIFEPLETPTFVEDGMRVATHPVLVQALSTFEALLLASAVAGVVWLGRRARVWRWPSLVRPAVALEGADLQLEAVHRGWCRLEWQLAVTQLRDAGRTVQQLDEATRRISALPQSTRGPLPALFRRVARQRARVRTRVERLLTRVGRPRSGALAEELDELEHLPLALVWRGRALRSVVVAGLVMALAPWFAPATVLLVPFVFTRGRLWTALSLTPIAIEIALAAATGWWAPTVVGGILLAAWAFDRLEVRALVRAPAASR